MKFEINSRGDEMWFNDKKEWHNIIGPAITRSDGSKFWYRNGLVHHLEGTAITHKDGREYFYWLGWNVTPQQHSVLSNISFFTKKVKI